MWLRAFRGFVNALGHILSSKGGDAGFYRLVKRREVIPLILVCMASEQVREGLV